MKGIFASAPAALEPLRETVAEAIYDADCEHYKPVMDKVPWDSIQGDGDQWYRDLSDAALNALTEAGLVIVRRDDVETVITVAEQSDFYESEHVDAMGRLRAAVAEEGEG